MLAFSVGCCCWVLIVVGFVGCAADGSFAVVCFWFGDYSNGYGCWLLVGVIASL